GARVHPAKFLNEFSLVKSGRSTVISRGSNPRSITVSTAKNPTIRAAPSPCAYAARTNYCPASIRNGSKPHATNRRKRSYRIVRGGGHGGISAYWPAAIFLSSLTHSTLGEFQMMRESITLYFREAGSDKVYRTSIDERDDGCVVNFAFGRRGST